MAVVNLLTSLSTTLTLLLLTPSSVTYGQVSSTTEFTEHCNLTLSSSTNVIYLSSPSSNVTMGIICQKQVLDGGIDSLRNEFNGEMITITVITNNSNIQGVNKSSTDAWLFAGTGQVDVRFNISTNTPLVAESIAVTVTASGKKNKRNSSIKLQLLDDRVDVGFLQEETTCQSDGNCDLKVIVNITMPDSPAVFNFDITLSLSVEGAPEMPIRVDNGVFTSHVRIEETGNYIATLTVPKDCERMVHWSRKNLSIRVTPNKMKEQLNELWIKYDNLTKYVQSLSNEIVELTDCTEVECYHGRHCVMGRCVCPQGYGGEDCTLIGCDSDPCGAYGRCTDPDGAGYKCECNEYFTGTNCTECQRGYCHDHGECTVEDGPPECTCDPGYDPGTKCSTCDDQHTGVDCTLEKCPGNDNNCTEHGTCYYKDSDKNDMGCFCEEGYSGSHCEILSTSAIVPTTSTAIVPTTPTVNVSTISTANVSTTPRPKDQETAQVPSDDNTLVYGGLVAFIALLVVCVAAYLLYHNKEKLLELMGQKKESVVEMAMKSRSKKSKGYQKLPTSIHDTMTHED